MTSYLAFSAALITQGAGGGPKGCRIKKKEEKEEENYEPWDTTEEERISLLPNYNYIIS